MRGINIVIPSFKRSDRLVGASYFKTAKYVVPESQADDYIKAIGKNRVITCPDKDDGNIARKRNWILRNIDRPLLMLDDDVKSLRTAEGIKANGKLDQHRTLSAAQAEGVIIQGFNLAYQWECPLWGLNVKTDGRNYQQYKPFSLTQVVLGPLQGHLEHNLYYDEEMGTKDDYDFNLQVLNEYRKILRFNKYSYDCDHGDNKGGIVSYRTMEKEVEYCRAIEKKWSRRIISYPLRPKRITELLNGRVSVPIKGV